MASTSPVSQTESSVLQESAVAADFDRRNRDWYIDKAVQILVFVAGISAIIFIVGIFVFITKEGFGFIVNTLNIGEFLALHDGDPPPNGIPLTAY